MTAPFETRRTNDHRDDRPAVLTDDMLARFEERAAVYDRENRFFTEDFEELRQAGYFLDPAE